MDSTALPSMAAQADETARSARVLERCREIAGHTEVPGQITRTFLSEPMREVHRLVRGWMEAAGMKTSVDGAGNVRGVISGPSESARRIILGSHLDSVRDAGAFDGVLGVVMAVAVAEELAEEMPFATEVIGFSEEEGVRFRRPFLGSLAAVGGLDAATLALVDAEQVSVAEAIRNFGLDPDRIPEAQLGADAAAYVEIHIEQGPVLEDARSRLEGAVPDTSAGMSARRPASVLGVVDTIAGQTRLVLRFEGQANHAGTTPMHLRHDALAAAAEWIVAAETLGREMPGLVATVGSVDVEPGVSNVISGRVLATLDVRHAEDSARQRAVAALIRSADTAACARGVRVSHETVLDQATVPMSDRLVRLLGEAATLAGHTPSVMASGAGHDAMILAPHLPSVMLFLPSPGGISHHPDESVRATDVEAGLQTMLEFLRLLRDDETLAHA